ncbi:MAG: hemoglobin [Hyphomicrobiaceae bacterium]|jgi:hemoglobin
MMTITTTTTTTPPLYGTDDASFQAAGGVDGLRVLVDDFYRIMGELPQAHTILRMHPADLTESRDKLTRFLCGWLGGPKLFSQTYGPIRIPAAHSHLRIGQPEHDAWLACMEQAIALQPFEPDFAVYLLEQLRVPAGRVLTASKDPV